MLRIALLFAAYKFLSTFFSVRFGRAVGVVLRFLYLHSRDGAASPRPTAPGPSSSRSNILIERRAPRRSITPAAHTQRRMVLTAQAPAISLTAYVIMMDPERSCAPLRRTLRNVRLCQASHPHGHRPPGISGSMRNASSPSPLR